MAYDDKAIQFFKFGPRILARYDDASPTSFSCFANDPNTGTNLIEAQKNSRQLFGNESRFQSRIITHRNLFKIGKSIAGNWASKLGRTSTPNWGICIDGEGALKGSYEFTAINGYGNNITVKGYSDG